MNKGHWILNGTFRDSCYCGMYEYEYTTIYRRLMLLSGVHMDKNVCVRRCDWKESSLDAFGASLYIYTLNHNTGTAAGEVWAAAVEGEDRGKLLPRGKVVLCSFLKLRFPGFPLRSIEPRLPRLT